MGFNIEVRHSTCKSWLIIEENTPLSTTSQHGSFRIYTFCLAKFFWETLGLARTIQINGQSYCVDLIEFSNWVSHHNQIIKQIITPNLTAQKVNSFFIGRQENAPPPPSNVNPQPPPAFLSQLDEKITASATAEFEWDIKIASNAQQEQKVSQEELLSDEEFNKIVQQFPIAFPEKNDWHFPPNSFFDKISRSKKLSALFLARIKNDPNFCKKFSSAVENFCKMNSLSRTETIFCANLIKNAVECLGIQEYLPFLKEAPLTVLAPLIESPHLTSNDLKELNLTKKIKEFVSKFSVPSYDERVSLFENSPRLFSALAHLTSQDKEFMRASLPLVVSLCVGYKSGDDNYKKKLNVLVAKVLESVEIKEFMALTKVIDSVDLCLQLYEIIESHTFIKTKKREIISVIKTLFLEKDLWNALHIIKYMKPVRVFELFDLLELTEPEHLEKLMVFPIVALLFSNPEELLQLLRTKEYFLKELAIHSETLSEVIKEHSLIGIPRNQAAQFASCIEILAKNQSIGWKPFFPILQSLIKLDFTVATSLIAQNLSPLEHKKEIREMFEEALKWDTPYCFELFLKLWGDNPAAWEGRKKVGYFMCLLAFKAAENGATKCLSLISGRMKEIDRGAIAKDYKAFPEIVLSALKNDYKKAASVIFEEMIQMRESWLKNEEETKKVLKKCVTTMLRFTTIKNTDLLFQHFLENCSVQEKEHLNKLYTDIKKDALRLLPLISRHNTPKMIKLVLNKYAPDYENSAIENIIAQDFEYAEACRTKAEELLKSLKTNTLQFEDPKSKFEKKLLPSKNKPRNVAMLVEKIALFRSYKEAVRTKNAYKSKEFKTVRLKLGGFTGVNKAYLWALPLISSVFHLSKSTEFDFGLCKSMKRSYKLKHKNNLVTETWIKPVYMPYVDVKPYEIALWEHGRSPLKTTWPHIEELFDSLLNRDLTLPKVETEQSMAEYRARMDAFYSTLAQLLGCVGKTQPLKRGSGTVEEFLFTIIHLYHGLEPPILRPSFPQFGVLDITFPDSEPNAEYPKFFTALFDPDSLPKHTTALKLPENVSIYSQMEALYQQI